MEPAGAAAPGDNREEGERLAEAARAHGLPLKLFGGVAVALLCPSAAKPPLHRDPADIDFATLSRSTRQVTAFFESEGYQADRLFNALHGASRLTFSGPGRDIDVIVNRFVMCHTIDLRQALARPGLAVPVTYLLLMKLQIVELNQKDMQDILAILADHDTEDGGATDDDDPQAIDRGLVDSLTRGDWGLEHTIRRTLGRVPAAALELGLPEDVAGTVNRRAASLLERLDGAPKSARWKLRAAIGERVRWYELPEEARH